MYSLKPQWSLLFFSPTWKLAFFFFWNISFVPHRHCHNCLSCKIVHRNSISQESSHMKLLFVIFFLFPFCVRNDIFYPLTILSCLRHPLSYRWRQHYCTIFFLLILVRLPASVVDNAYICRMRVVRKHSVYDIVFVYVAFIKKDLYLDSVCLEENKYGLYCYI
jgi:hypothetical protein